MSILEQIEIKLNEGKQIKTTNDFVFDTQSDLRNTINKAKKLKLKFKKISDDGGGGYPEYEVSGDEKNVKSFMKGLGFDEIEVNGKFIDL